MEREYLNSGTLFSNKVKKNPKAPDYTGDMTLDLAALGVGTGKAKLRLSGWKKTSQKGTTFLSLSIQKFEQSEKPQQKAENTDEDIPF